MTWRRFVELLSGLSFESRWCRALQADAHQDRDTVRIDDPAAAEAYFGTIG